MIGALVGVTSGTIKMHHRSADIAGQGTCVARLLTVVHSLHFSCSIEPLEFRIHRRLRVLSFVASYSALKVVQKRKDDLPEILFRRVERQTGINGKLSIRVIVVIDSACSVSDVKAVWLI